MSYPTAPTSHRLASHAGAPSGANPLRGIFSALLAALALLVASPAWAQTDAVSFGDSVHVPYGQHVASATSFGGDAVIEGTVSGDAVAFGGDVIVRPGGRVDGTLTSFGGAVLDQRASYVFTPEAVEPGAFESEAAEAGAASSRRKPEGPFESFVSWVQDTARSLLAHVMIFLLGLLMIGVMRERLRAMQTTMIRDGARTAGWGVLGYLVSGVGAVVLALTIIGIPVAVAVAMALPVATYVGLAAAATVIGAALPVPQLKGWEILQLAAGVGVLFIASLVPVAGFVATCLAACLGFGALLRTRLSATPPSDLPAEPRPGALSPEGA